MSLSDTGALLDLINKAGVVGLLSFLLILVLVGSYRGWWYTGPAYKALQQERDSWRTIALSGITTAKSAADLAQRQLGLPQ